ncbi:hypothetical protein [Deinococcus koreensis]|uniref:Uncharacterized protein n=1 Tax=Deinococcus koreensis TaxID=2054903 RepID=A0A2K3UUC0_9DEIO|nr:hypothetical protein [Deinococcus koreensis]PNY80134.1 hypothetical protein CVO96_01090 [Deinococcus koreensis]
MRPWMLEAPRVKLPESAVQAFERAWSEHDLTALPDGVPRWLFLEWLAGRGLLLHGSPHTSLTELVPRDHDYAQPDDFSNTIGVYATSDALWAMMYAFRSPNVAQQSDMALRQWEDGQWSPMRYFYSVAPLASEVTDARTLLQPGAVYVLSRSGFRQSPAYEHGGLGLVLEAHWVNPKPVRPLMIVPVYPADFPLPVRLHDAARVKALSYSAPWGFPWLEPETPT